MYVLGIESSCDETGIAILKDRRLIAHTLFTQIDLHQIYGGVVPEIASRAHIEKVDILLKQTLEDAHISLSDLDVIAAVQGPGLIGGVNVGLTFGKALAYALDKPFIGINHLEAHALMPRFENEIPFPHLVFLASGGHTQFILMNGIGDYKILGTTLDDALGEAFDKVAKLLNLPYPGGPEVDKNAKFGDKTKYNFPRPMKGKIEPNFSFSGLKSAVRRIAQEKESLSETEINDICASFQEAVCETVEDRLETVLQQTKNLKLNGVAFAGGVARNTFLRERLKTLCAKEKIPFFVPTPSLCVDNGVMIAWAGYERARLKKFSDMSATAYPRKNLEEIK
ncbi:MAG: tRNA (adenosine(37)-N6)-threonylcarbamoyltransferase complex transferase subunit TsaD [Alphaproteobacteria bacterium]|nr:tRNA (adenosine(37)-N6)-threonylcarbamoyltransferase complex transferase subunit TsaD [Alphaproteobacteria bacterium]